MKRGKVTAEKKAERSVPHHRHHRLRRPESTDLVVEAVFEDPKVKADVTAKVEAATDRIYATNTSSCRSPALPPRRNGPRALSASTSSAPSTR